MPFVVMIPLFTFLIIYFNGKNLSNEGTLSNKELQTVCLITFGLYLLIPLIVSNIYLFTYSKYKKQISFFSKEELEKINEEAKTVYNMGKLLITNDAIIFFGFFSKKVIPTKIIEKVYKVEGTAPGRWSDSGGISYHTIILECKNNEKIYLPAPKNYNNIECLNCKNIIEKIVKNNKINENLSEKKYINVNSLEEAKIFRNYKETRLLSFIDIIVAILYLLLCLIINKLIKTNINNGSNFVLKTFYSIGIEEFLINIEFVIYTIYFVIMAVYSEFFDKNKEKGNTIAGTCRFVMGTLLITILFSGITIPNYDYQKDVRSDYISYLNDEYKTYTGKVSYFSGGNYPDVNDVSWTGYYHGKKKSYSANNEVFIYTKGSLDEDKIYKITYLPKTHLIVDINEETY
jgi:hypothetical protein